MRILFVALLALAAAASGEMAYRAPSTVEQAAYLGTDGDGTLVAFNLQALTVEDAMVDGFGPASVFRIPGAGFVAEIGSPDLPALRRMVQIASTGDYRLEVVSEETSVLGIYGVAPCQEPATRNGQTFPYRENSSVYGSSELFPSSPVTLESIQLLRDIRIAWLRFNPVRYNPSTGETFLTTSAVVRIVPTGQPGENEFVRAAQGITREFLPVYEEVLGFDASGQNTLSGSYLVIGTTASIALCQDLIDWKREKGYEIEYGIVPTIGTTSSAIDAWITTAYNTWPNPPLWILICGDNTQVPTPMSGSTAQDNQYGCIGSTCAPVIHVGRICNQDTDDLAYQTWKIQNYELDPYMPEPSWFQNAISIGSTDFQDPAHSWEYAVIFMAHGMTVDYFCDQGGTPPTVANISASVNEGTSLISYIGHGDTQYWVTSGFDNGDVAALTNGRRMPWINSIACYNAAFTSAYCFGEAWMNEGSVATPKGAIGFMGATTASPVGQTDSLAEYTFRGYFEQEIWHMGSAVDYGKLKVVEFYGEGSAASNNNMHMIFGCPETDIFTETSPLPALTGAHESTISPGTFNVTVTSAGTPVEGALVGAVQDTTYLDGAYTNSSGVATLTIPSLQPSPWVTITATYHNRAPYRGSANPGTGIGDGGSGPAVPAWLATPAPSPFTGSTAIGFATPGGTTRLTVFDMAGRLVRTISSGEIAGGEYSMLWDGRDDSGASLGAGIYMIRLSTPAGGFTSSCVKLD